MEAGIERLNRFSEWLVVDALAGGDITKMEDIVLMPYKDVMLAIWVRKEQGDFRERLSRKQNKG